MLHKLQEVVTYIYTSLVLNAQHVMTAIIVPELDLTCILFGATGLQLVYYSELLEHVMGRKKTYLEEFNYA